MRIVDGWPTAWHHDNELRGFLCHLSLSHELGHFSPCIFVFVMLLVFLSFFRIRMIIPTSLNHDKIFHKGWLRLTEDGTISIRISLTNPHFSLSKVVNVQSNYLFLDWNLILQLQKKFWVSIVLLASSSISRKINLKNTLHFGFAFKNSILWRHGKVQKTCKLHPAIESFNIHESQEEEGRKGYSFV